MTTAAPAQTNTTPAKAKIGIMKFEVAKDLNPSLSGLLYDTLTEQVVNSKKFTVVDWESIDRMLQYMAKSQPNLSQEDARKQAVNQLGIQQLYFGSAAKLGSKYFLSVKVLNLDLSVDKVEKESVESEEQMIDAVATITARLLGHPSPAAKTAAALESKPAASGLPAATKGKPFVNSLGMKFVPVPGTKVLFCIWETRVKDFRVFVSETGHDATRNMLSLRNDGWKQRGDTWENPGFAQEPTHPVCGVSWEDAKVFCQWLAERDRREGKLVADQRYRLPTDAEWSAAVGLEETIGSVPGEKSERTEGVYPWGSGWPPPANSGNFAGEEATYADWPSNMPVIAGYSDGFSRTGPVGSFPPNRYGLYDLSGNVWEWCEDWYDRSQEYHASRGGSWGTLPNFPATRLLLSSYRGAGPPGYRSNDTGFRVVLVESSR
ncbi:MAG: SUMF1/EgtB/PvdO family nonheme iron enzyme [Verrucomicrobia bacterium]|nr:SUMF1/EgtB/PvdO family nonheme iron enzyme [Verrucomicrobiota bacterium]